MAIFGQTIAAMRQTLRKRPLDLRKLVSGSVLLIFGSATPFGLSCALVLLGYSLLPSYLS
jgi:hypothetical protein